MATQTSYIACSLACYTILTTPAKALRLQYAQALLSKGQLRHLLSEESVCPDILWVPPQLTQGFYCVNSC